MSEWIHFLKQHPFFSGLPEGSLAEIAQQVSVRQFEKGDMIYSQGAPPRGLHMIVSGSVRIYRSSSTGKEQNLRRLAAGQSFADVSAFDGKRTIGFAQAIEPTVVLILPGHALHDAAKKYPEVAIGILNVWSRRIRDLSDLAGRLSMQHVSSRVASALLQLAGKKNTAVMPKKEDLATTVGTAREVVTRAIKQFERDGLIEVGKHRQFTILKRAALEEVSGDTSYPVPVASDSASTLAGSHSK